MLFVALLFAVFMVLSPFFVSVPQAAVQVAKPKDEWPEEDEDE